jgi:transcriptional regulator with XRE-family HTH domain
MQAITTAAQRRALGDFVRAHRARLTPAIFGLDTGSRRRTPGLRREEVAQLCGLSPTWYTWIEQGRDVSVSPAALARLAKTLQLSPAERAYLFELVGKRDPSGPRAEGAMDAPPAIVASLEAMALPAYLLDRTWTARAWNGPAMRLFTGWLDQPGERNLLRYIFLNPAARQFIRDWEDRARRVLAEFRADYSRHIDDPDLLALIDELGRCSPLFARYWDEQAVVGREGGERTFDHPEDGFLRYEQITFTLANRPEFKLVLLAPAAA